MKESGPIPRREFKIKPKSTNEWLKSVRGGGASGSRYVIAQDILDNAKELEPNVNWEEVSRDCIKSIENRYHTGADAIANSVARTMGSVATHMSWDMHSPEMVYMSGYHSYHSIEKELDSLNEKIKAGEDGSRAFINDEMKSTALAKEKSKASRIAVYKQKIGGTLTEFASQQFPQGETYLKILQRLPYLNSSELIPSRRKKGLDLLKAGQIDEAAAIILA